MADLLEDEFDWSNIESELAALEEEDNLANAKWFFPEATRATADALLTSARPRVFLVRPSSQEGKYALSMKRSNGEIMHAVIQRQDGDGGYGIEGAPDTYPSITLLVASLELVPLVRPDFVENKADASVDDSESKDSANPRVNPLELSTAASKLKAVGGPIRDKIISLTPGEAKRAAARKVRRNTTLADLSSAGWIVVNGERRWGVVMEGSFVWFDEQGKAEVGRQTLVGARARVLSETTAKLEFPSGKREPLELSFESGRMARAWIHMIGNAIVDGSVRAADNFTELDGEGQFRGVLRDFRSGKTHWYVLRGGYLMQFASLTSGASSALPVAGAAYASLEEATGQPGFRLVLADGMGEFDLGTTSEGYASIWRSALGDAIALAESTSSATAFAGDYQKRAGWSLKKGKRRYILMKEDSLIWSDREFEKLTEDIVPSIRGGINLAHASIFAAASLLTGADVKQRRSLSSSGRNFFAKVLSSDSDRVKRIECAFTIATLNGRAYTFEVETEEEAAAWIAALSKNAARASRLSDPAVAHKVVQDTGTASRSYSGWVVQRSGTGGVKSGVGKRRWYVLRDDLLLAFESADDVGETKPAMAMSLRCSSAQEATSTTLLLVSPDGDVLVLEPEGGPELRTAWLDIFGVAIRRANRQRVGGGSRSAAATTIARAGVCTIDGSRRYTELKAASLTWYRHTDARSRGDVEGSLGLADCKVEQLSRPENSFSVTTAKGKKYVFQCANAADQEGWVAEATTRVTVATQEKEAHFVAARAHQAELVEILTSPASEFAVLRVLFKVYGTDEVARAALRVCMAEGVHLGLMDTMIRDELKDSVSVGTLFRGDSSATKLCREFLKTAGRGFLREALGVYIAQIMDNPAGFEVDPNRLGEGEDVTANVARLDAVCEALLQSIMAASAKLPKEVFTFFELSKYAAEEYFRGSYHKVAAGFLFLRFLCPAIFSPVFFKLTTKQPEGKAQRALTLVSKVLQNLANGVAFGKKEPAMAPMNAFIDRNRGTIVGFFDDLAAGTVADTGTLRKSSAMVDGDEDDGVDLTMAKVSGARTADASLDADHLVHMAVLVRQLSNNFKAMLKEMDKTPDTYVEALGDLLRFADICGIDSSLKKMGKTGAVVDAGTVWGK
jgi:hypothetical protein